MIACRAPYTAGELRGAKMSEHRHWDPNVGMEVVRYDERTDACDRCGAPLDKFRHCTDSRCPYHDLEVGSAYFEG